MKRLIAALVLLLVLVGCSDKEDDLQAATDNESEIDETIVPEDEEEELEREPLPFNVDDFEVQYNEIIQNFDDFSDSERLFINENSINLMSGHLIEAQALLNTLGILTEKEEINILTNELIDEVIEQGFYINELEIDKMEINITAIDIGSVTLNVNGKLE